MQNEGATQKILSALEQAALNHHIDIVDVEIVWFFQESCG